MLPNIKQLAGSLILVALLIGCGGGGGGSSNQPPIVDAGDDQVIGVAPSQIRTITLSGSATDSDGTIVSQLWVQTNGTPVNLSGVDTTSATFSVNGTAQTYSFRFTATDNNNAQASDSVNVIVNVSNAPVVDAGSDQFITMSASQSRIITLTGSASDSDGTIAYHQWEQISGSDVALAGADTATASFTVDSTPQTYTFRYTATDNLGVQGSDEVSVIVSLNSPPVADAGFDQTVTLYNSETRLISLTGTANDIDGTVVAQQWVQTGGPPLTLSGASTANLTLTVDATTNAYTFSYTATDDFGDQGTDSVTVYVTNVIYSDSFANDSGWSYVDDSGKGYDWVVTIGQLRQNDYVVSRSGSTTYQIGTFARLIDASMNGRSSYGFSVDITPLPNNVSDDSQGNDVGIMFRYIDPNNYYRVAMNAKFGYTRFEKRKDGVFETLAVNAIGYVDNQSITMKSEVNNNTIIVWIDDEPIFAVVDDAPISSGTVALYCQDKAQFDNVKVTEPSLEPTIAINRPLAFSVALTREDGNDLSVQAVALNAPIDANVGLSLADGSGTIAERTANLSGGVYTAQFISVPDGNYEIKATILDENAEEVGSDINSMVGIGGDYHVTIGDSITNGFGDTISDNNFSIDGRIVAIQGYQAPLADLLTDATGLPQIVFNEAIPGDTAAGLSSKIASILERHPGANKVLMMIGTNDSNVGGIGVDPAVFETDVETIASVIDNGSGRRLWLAKPLPTYLNDSPPTTLDATRNARIELYNSRLESVAGNHANTEMGPDFYNSQWFNSTINPDFADYLFDYLHPNDPGYQRMSEEWLDTLSQP